MGGCSALERAHQCGGLAEIVNSGLEEVRFDAPDAGSGESYERFALAYDQANERIEALGIDDPALSKVVGSYREILDRAAKHSRAYAHELVTRGASKGERRSAERRIERIRAQAKNDLAREASTIRKINAVCHPR